MPDCWQVSARSCRAISMSSSAILSLSKSRTNGIIHHLNPMPNSACMEHILKTSLHHHDGRHHLTPLPPAGEAALTMPQAPLESAQKHLNQKAPKLPGSNRSKRCLQTCEPKGSNEHFEFFVAKLLPHLIRNTLKLQCSWCNVDVKIDGPWH